MNQAQVAIAIEVDARKDPIGAEEAWNRVRQASRVVIGKGQKVQNYDDIPANQEAIMNDILGRSGTLRAPALQIGATIYIGYNEILYKGFSGQH